MRFPWTVGHPHPLIVGPACINGASMIASLCLLHDPATVSRVWNNQYVFPLLLFFSFVREEILAKQYNTISKAFTGWFI